MRTIRFNEFLPEHIIFEILLLLPVSLLVRVRSVCKFWLSIISNPRFVQTHLANSRNKQAYVLEIQYYNEPDDYAVYVHTRDVSARRNLPPQLEIPGYRSLVFSCNGLVCLANRETDVIYLWNPCTNCFKIAATNSTSNFCNWDAPKIIMFCFDPVSNDYKLLRFEISGVYKAELYSANADSWKEIHVPERLHNVFLQSTPLISFVVINEVIFMRTLYDELIISFDFCNEVFREIGVSCSKPESNLVDVLDFEGSLAIVCSDDTSVYSLYTLDDKCGNLSWIKKFNFVTDIKIEAIELYLGEGQFVVRDEEWVPYMFYDYLKKETRKFSSPSISFSHIKAVKYTPSLVSLKGFEQLK